jgi:excisionase family DNA binding protein
MAKCAESTPVSAQFAMINTASTRHQRGINAAWRSTVRWGRVVRSAAVAESEDRLLTPNEVATLFRVDQKTVTRWAKAGRVPAIRTPGGHWRFRESEMRTLIRDSRMPSPRPALE